MPDYKLKSGRQLTASPAAWQDANGLRKAVMRVMSRAGLDGFATEAATQVLLADQEVEDAFFRCAAAAIYAGAKVRPELFDDPQLGADARSDYFEVFARVMGVNLDPFFQNASSASGTSSPTADGGQPSTSA